MDLEKVAVKEGASLVLGTDNVCCISFKPGQRWYVLGRPDNAGKFYTVERDNVKVQITGEDYSRLFRPFGREGKWA